MEHLKGKTSQEAQWYYQMWGEDSRSVSTRMGESLNDVLGAPY